MPTSPKRRDARIKSRKSRPTATTRGYDSRWRRARRQFLAVYPLCMPCELAGRITPANELDHIIPHKQRERLFWDEGNWCQMCKPCHQHKTNAEYKTRTWNPNGKRVVLCGLPAAGKSTLAQKLDGDVWDADEWARQHELTQAGDMPADYVSAMRNDRDKWLYSHRRSVACVCIVSHPVAALRAAEQLRGIVHHVMADCDERQRRVRRRQSQIETAAGGAGRFRKC